MKKLFWPLVFFATGYFGYMFIPAYVESFQVKQVLREVANAAIKETDPDRLKQMVINKCRTIGSHYEIREGQEVIQPGIVMLLDDIYVNRDDEEKTIIIQADYQKVVNYPFTERQVTLNFSPAIKEDITPVVW